MQEKVEIERVHGAWTVNFRLTEDLWTISPDMPVGSFIQHVLQFVSDLTGRLSGLRVLDLACLEGHYALEFGLHGAKVVGIEGRERSVSKAEWARRLLGLEHVRFMQDDVRQVTRERYGEFDIILCLGILYHLDASDIRGLVRNLVAMAPLAVFDTHISLSGQSTLRDGTVEYRGRWFQEHRQGAAGTEREAHPWSSIGNERSFWLTKPSLLNLLRRSGYSSVYECQVPYRQDFLDRVMLAAVRGHPVSSFLGPSEFRDWPEREERRRVRRKSRIARLLAELRTRLGSK